MNDQSVPSFPYKRLKHVVSLRGSRVQGIGDGRPYVGLEHIESRTGRLLTNALTNAQETLGRLVEGASLSNTFEPNDVLFGKLRPYLGKAWVAEFRGRSSTEFLVMQPVEIQPRFLRYVCLSCNFVDTVDASTFGSKMPRADWDSIGNVRVPVPDSSKQRAIANYLDRETARLDALVAEQERLLSLVAERRRALVTRAVFGRANSGVTLRDSGLPWLGAIPEHWEIWKLAHLASIGNGSTPNRSRPEYWEKGDIPWLNSSIVNQREISAAAQFVTSLAIRECHLPIVRSGAVLVAITGQGQTRGRAAVLSIDATVNQHIAFISPVRSRLSSWYLKWTLSAAYDFLRSVSDDVGGTKGALTCEELANLHVPVPPSAEQREIVSMIASGIYSTEKLAAATGRAIAILQERRSALIKRAVTGEIDVGR